MSKEGQGHTLGVIEVHRGLTLGAARPNVPVSEHEVLQLLLLDTRNPVAIDDLHPCPGSSVVARSLEWGWCKLACLPNQQSHLSPCWTVGHGF